MERGGGYFFLAGMKLKALRKMTKYITLTHSDEVGRILTGKALRHSAELYHAQVFVRVHVNDSSKEKKGL